MMTTMRSEYKVQIYDMVTCVKYKSCRTSCITIKAVRTHTSVIQYKVQHDTHTVDALDGKNVTKKLGEVAELLERESEMK